jgi:2-aminoadipate transaminase
VHIARQYGVPIIEDDLRQAAIRGEHIPPLLVYDAPAASDSVANGNVLGVGTFSKTLCPGFRVAWIVGPVEVISRLAEAKEDGDLHTSTFAQAVVHETAREGFYEQHIAGLRRAYGERRALMLSLMEEMFPRSMTWTRPEGGLFVWVRLPEDYDALVLLNAAVKKGVAFVPGQPFFPNGEGRNTFRMNFSNSTPARIEEGMKRLVTALHEVARQPS